MQQRKSHGGAGLRLFLIALLVIPAGMRAQAPAWWSTYGVLSGTTANDYAAANQGQVKNIALAAVAEMDTDLAQFGGSQLDYLTASGSFGTIGSFSGQWDGIYFTGLPSGLVISTAQPSPSPSAGPPEIIWNGVTLVFNPTASEVSGSNLNSGDVYQDSAGISLSAAIQSDGTVTLVDSNGTSYSGSYDSSSGAFFFSGSSPGTVAAAGNGVSAGGTPPVITSGTSTQIPGDLDIEGNHLTTGTWYDDANNSVNTLGISYSDGTNGSSNLIRSGATRAVEDWIWSEATSDNSNPPVSMMEVDPNHRLILHEAPLRMPQMSRSTPADLPSSSRRC